jgi:hypothetical protein
LFLSLTCSRFCGGCRLVRFRFPFSLSPHVLIVKILFLCCRMSSARDASACKFSCPSDSIQGLDLFSSCH